MLRIPDVLWDRFWSKVDVSGDCWEWQSTPDKDGYGDFKVYTKRDRELRLTRKPHRLVWQMLVGPIPDKCEIDHRCFNRRCCNPDHLEPVPRRENLRRSRFSCDQRNAAKTHCPKGHEYAGANLKIGTSHMGGPSRFCIACVAINSAAYRQTESYRQAEIRSQARKKLAKQAAQSPSITTPVLGTTEGVRLG